MVTKYRIKKRTFVYGGSVFIPQFKLGPFWVSIGRNRNYFFAKECTYVPTLEGAKLRLFMFKATPWRNIYLLRKQDEIVHQENLKQ